jgi:hypothetical protein
MSEQAVLVPLSQAPIGGTGGQNPERAGQAWDSAGTNSVRALAAKVLRRDKGRDSGGTDWPISCPTPSGAVGQDLPAVPLAPNAFAPPDDVDQRAALIEYGAGVPRTWAEGYAALSSMPSPAGFSSERWSRIVDAAGNFIDRYAGVAIECGWSDLDVFGCDPDRPDARFDCMGLVLLLDRCEIIGIDEDGADLVTETGTCQRYRRRPLPVYTVSLWVLGRDD